MSNSLLKRFQEYLSYEFPHLGVAILALLAAAIWKGSAAAAIGAVILVIVHSKETLIASILEVFKKPGANPADEQKLRAVVESLNKIHANEKALDEKIEHVANAVGKLNLRIALKPLDEATKENDFLR